MNYTKNYRLPQWVKEDRIMMDDFNAAMASMESGMTASTSIANTAKQTADAAKQRVDTAYTPDNKPYVTGHYVGRDADVTVYLGFRPSFVIVSGMVSSTSTTIQSTYDRYFAMTGGNAVRGRIDFTDTGFIARAYNSYIYPHMNDTGRTYDYIAFK